MIGSIGSNAFNASSNSSNNTARTAGNANTNKVSQLKNRFEAQNIPVGPQTTRRIIASPVKAPLRQQQVEPPLPPPRKAYQTASFSASSTSPSSSIITSPQKSFKEKVSEGIEQWKQYRIDKKETK